MTAHQVSAKRSLKKAQRRAEILAAASRLFSQNGYRRTTFDEIAAASGSGVATVYKHFKNKEGLVVAILEPDLHEIEIRARQVIAHPAPDPGHSMVELLSCYRNVGGSDWSNRELLRLTVFPGIENSGSLRDLVIRADAATQGQIQALLRVQKRLGRLAPDLPLRDAAAVIFSLLNQHFGMYLTQPKLSFEEMFRMLSRRVLLVFDRWRR